MRYFRRSYNLFSRRSDQRGNRVRSDGDGDSTESNESELQSSDESDDILGGNGGDSNRSMICGLCNCIAEVSLY
jgi:hypothetical protein